MSDTLSSAISFHALIKLDLLPRTARKSFRQGVAFLVHQLLLRSILQLLAIRRDLPPSLLAFGSWTMSKISPIKPVKGTMCTHPENSPAPHTPPVAPAALPSLFSLFSKQAYTA